MIITKKKIEMKKKNPKKYQNRKYQKKIISVNVAKFITIIILYH
jgi:hypothetical protein